MNLEVLVALHVNPPAILQAAFNAIPALDVPEVALFYEPPAMTIPPSQVGGNLRH
jgi:hypothetical protein